MLSCFPLQWESTCCEACPGALFIFEGRIEEADSDKLFLNSPSFSQSTWLTELHRLALKPPWNITRLENLHLFILSNPKVHMWVNYNTETGSSFFLLLLFFRAAAAAHVSTAESCVNIFFWHSWLRCLRSHRSWVICCTMRWSFDRHLTHF